MSCFKDSLPDYPLSSIYTGLLYLLNGFSLHLIEPLGNPETPKNMSIVYTYKTTSRSCHPWQLLKVSTILRTPRHSRPPESRPERFKEPMHTKVYPWRQTCLTGRLRASESMFQLYGLMVSSPICPETLQNGL